MKAELDPTTPKQKYRTIEKALHQILTVSKDDLKALEKQYQDSQKGKPKRGPKPRHS